MRANPLVLALTVALIVGIFLADPFIPLGLTVGVLYAIPVALIGFWSSSTQSKLVVITVSVCTGLIFLGLLLASPMVLHNDFLNRGIAGITIWGVAGVSLMRKRMVQEVKALRGLLSICSYCKKVRDSNDTWTPLELFVTRHSEADFSHGICPTCLPKYFPESANQENIDDSHQNASTHTHSVSACDHSYGA
jgi:hypothetical protein